MPIKKEHGRLVKATVGKFNLIEICNHALDRMKGRGVSQDEVIKTLRSPTRKGVPTQPGRKRVRKNRRSSEAVDVVYKEGDDRLVVITVIVIRGRRSRKRK